MGLFVCSLRRIFRIFTFFILILMGTYKMIVAYSHRIYNYLLLFLSFCFIIDAVCLHNLVFVYLYFYFLTLGLGVTFRVFTFSVPL
jgi:hypothetical protein